MFTSDSRAGTILSTYNGAVTELVCSTGQPSFIVNGVYDSFSYSSLPDLFGIEANIAEDSSHVNLSINGTSMIHNVTVECRNLIDSVRGKSESLYNVTLQFIGEFYIITM